MEVRPAAAEQAMTGSGKSFAFIEPPKIPGSRQRKSIQLCTSFVVLFRGRQFAAGLNAVRWEIACLGVGEKGGIKGEGKQG